MVRRSYCNRVFVASSFKYWFRVPRIHFASTKFDIDRDVGISWKTSWDTLFAIVLCRSWNHRHDSLV